MFVRGELRAVLHAMCAGAGTRLLCLLNCVYN